MDKAIERHFEQRFAQKQGSANADNQEVAIDFGAGCRIKETNGDEAA